MATSNCTNNSEHRQISHSLGTEWTVTILAVCLQLQNEACSTVIHFQCSQSRYELPAIKRLLAGMGWDPAICLHSCHMSAFHSSHRVPFWSHNYVTVLAVEVFIDVLFTSRPCKPLPNTNHPHRYELLDTQHCHHGRRTAARETRKVSKLATVSSAGS
jgi:hypothetical protein